MKKSLIFICIACALMTIFFSFYNRQWLWIFKPMPLLIMMGWLAWRTPPSEYRSLIILGLICSVIGDLFLIVPDQYFLHGLSSFFFAHICYILAFSRARIAFDKRSLWAYGYGIVMYLVIQNGIPPDLKWPVIAYTVAICTMLVMAINLQLTQPEMKSKFILIGAILFVISDSLIAINKFYHPFFMAGIIILATYFTAQGFITSSVRRKTFV